MIPIDRVPLDSLRELVRLVAAMAVGNEPRSSRLNDPKIRKLIEDELTRQRSAADNSPISANLPPRLRRVLPLILQGTDIPQIAKALNLSPYTVREYIQDIYRHFGVCRRAQLQSLLADHTTRTLPHETLLHPSPRRNRPRMNKRIAPRPE